MKNHWSGDIKTWLFVGQRKEKHFRQKEDKKECPIV
jgi:hypothetical protein